MQGYIIFNWVGDLWNGCGANIVVDDLANTTINNSTSDQKQQKLFHRGLTLMDNIE